MVCKGQRTICGSCFCLSAMCALEIKCFYLLHHLLAPKFEIFLKDHPKNIDQIREYYNFCCSSKFLLCNPGWPGTQYVTQTGIELEAPASLTVGLLGATKSWNLCWDGGLLCSPCWPHPCHLPASASPQGYRCMPRNPAVKRKLWQPPWNLKIFLPLDRPHVALVDPKCTM